VKTFVLLMHIIIWDKDFNMWRGLTFYEPKVPKYESIEACEKQGKKLIANTIHELNKIDVKVKEWDMDCIEVKKTSI